MKTIRCLVVFTLVFLALGTMSVLAVDESDTDELLDEMQQSVSEELSGTVPESAEQMLEENGLSEFDTQAITDFQFTDLFQSIFQYIVQTIGTPFRLFILLVGVFMLMALVDSLHTSEQMVTVQNFVGLTALLVVISSPVIECVQRAVNTIVECSQFLLGFIPVFTGVVAAAGKPVSSLTYSSFLFGTVQVISQIASSVLTPLLCIYLALCICGALNPQLHLDSAAASVKKVVIWTIGLLLTIFVALLSIQSLVSGASDTIATKTTKFFIGSSIPVFGSALSDVYSSIQGCLGFMKQVTGSFSIIVVICTFLPIVIDVLFIMLAVNLGAVVGDVMGVTRMCKLLRSVSSMLSLLLGLILCFAVMVIVSTTIIMVLSMGM